MTSTKPPTPPKAGNGDNPANSVVVKCPMIEDGNEFEQKLIKDAHKKAKDMIDSAINNCLEKAKSQPNGLVSNFFGINGTADEDKKKLDQLIKNYQKIQSGMDKASYEVEHEEITPGEPYKVAYVYTLPLIHGIGDVHTVFPAFAMGTDDDRASTLVHEMSHYAVGTEDHAYDWETTKWNKLTQKQKMDNADSYGNFASDCYNSTKSGT